MTVADVPLPVPLPVAGGAGEVLVELLALLELPAPELLVALLELFDVPELLTGVLAVAAGVPLVPLVPLVPVVVVAGAAVPAGVSLPPPHDASRPDARSVNRILFFSNMQDNLSCRV